MSNVLGLEHINIWKVVCGARNCQQGHGWDAKTLIFDGSRPESHVNAHLINTGWKACNWGYETNSSLPGTLVWVCPGCVEGHVAFLKRINRWDDYAKDLSNGL